jgi:hypothetical protein
MITAAHDAVALPAWLPMIIQQGLSWQRRRSLSAAAFG